MIPPCQTPEPAEPTARVNQANAAARMPHPTVPQLGPPLPGDLGRPILNSQNRGQPVPGASAEEQRRLQEIEAARTSRLFSGTETRSAPATPAPAPSETPALEVPSLAGLGLAPEPATPTAQEGGLPQRPGRPPHGQSRSRCGTGLAIHLANRLDHRGGPH